MAVAEAEIEPGDASAKSVASRRMDKARIAVLVVIVFREKNNRTDHLLELLSKLVFVIILNSLDKVP